MRALVSWCTPVLYLQWDFAFGGYNHPIIVLGTWSTLICLYILNSYIFFTLGAGMVGCIVLRKVRTREWSVQLPSLHCTSVRRFT